VQITNLNVVMRWQRPHQCWPSNVSRSWKHDQTNRNHLFLISTNPDPKPHTGKLQRMSWITIISPKLSKILMKSQPSNYLSLLAFSISASRMQIFIFSWTMSSPTDPVVSTASAEERKMLHPHCFAAQILEQGLFLNELAQICFVISQKI